MRISSSMFSNNFLLQINQLEQRQNTLQSQASSGQKITRPEDDPAAMASVLNLQTSVSANTQYQNNIAQLQSSATASYSAMDSLKTISDRAGEIATLASNGTTSPQQYASYATEVGQLIQQAVAVGNTQDANGNYIFGGTLTNGKPFSTTTDASNAVTAVTYQGNTSVAQSEIAPGLTVTTQTPGANTTGSGPTGLFTDSRSGADFFNHLLSLQKNLAAGTGTAISSTDTPQLAKDEANIINQMSANGVTQSALSHANNSAAAQSANTITQISGLTNADLATTLTQLQQTQTAYQAALQSGTKVLSLSLLDYLH
ncbi:MAG: flagellin [Pedosphaera sp.]|nr:flagellin [Pedosphaera sp.]